MSKFVDERGGCSFLRRTLSASYTAVGQHWGRKIPQFGDARETTAKNAGWDDHSACGPEILPRTCLSLRAIWLLIRRDWELSDDLPVRALRCPWVGHFPVAINSSRFVASLFA